MSLERLELVLGSVVLVAGLFYLLVGVPWVEPSGSVHLRTGKSLILGVNDPYSLDGKFSISLRWSAGTPVTVIVRECGSSSTCQPVKGILWVSPNESVGSFEFSASQDSYYGVTPSAQANLSFVVTTSFPYFLVALPPVAGGAALLLVATRSVWLQRREVEDPNRGSVESPEPSERSSPSSVTPLLMRGQDLVLPCENCGAVIRVVAGSPIGDSLACPVCAKRVEAEYLNRVLDPSLELQPRTRTE